MDPEVKKLFDERMNRLKEITKLAYNNIGDNQEMYSDIVDRVKNAVKGSVPVAIEAARANSIAKNVVIEVDKCEDFRKVNVNDIYEQEAQKDIAVPTFNFEEEYQEFVSSLSNQEGEDSFIVSQESAGPMLDPWTKVPIKNPMKSKQCGHIFDRASIRVALQNKREFRCPYIGCKARLTLDDLEED